MKTIRNIGIFIFILIAASIAEYTVSGLKLGIVNRLSNFLFSPCPYNGHCVIEKDGVVKEGRFVDGKRHGRWVLRWADGGVQEGEYVDGKKHGDWVFRYANGGVREGPFVDGKIHGKWVWRSADGVELLESCYENGDEIDC